MPMLCIAIVLKPSKTHTTMRLVLFKGVSCFGFFATFGV